MAKKRAPKRRAWNKGLEVGKRDGFTPDQVKRIRGLLADRGVPGLRDLALFSTAIDTMLHGQDLLALVVGDVQRRDGSIRPVVEVARARGMPPVRCVLSKASTKALEKWITASGKKRTDYLFPGRGVEGRHPMGQRQLNRLLKLWVVEAGLDPSDYSVEVFTPDEGSPYFERHWRFADGSSALGPCTNREHSEISRSQDRGRPNRGLSRLRYLTLSVPIDSRPIGGWRGRPVCGSGTAVLKTLADGPVTLQKSP
jgi:Phage integrase family